MIEGAQNVFLTFNILMAAVNIILGVINIFLFFQNRKERWSRLGRDISIMELEIEALKQRHQLEREELEDNYEGECKVSEFVSVDLRTENDKRNFDKLQQRQRNEEEKIFTELLYLYELKAGKSRLLVVESGRKRFWNIVSEIFK